jgi:phage terminase small subunit
MNENPIRLPKDPRRQRFADLILGGMRAPEAYKKAGFKAVKPASLHTVSSRLLKNVEVQAYLADVRQQSAKATVMSVAEKREFLARIVRTPLRAIDPNDPDHKDGDLILKYKRTASETGEMEEIVKLDPLKAIDQDNKLSGDDPEANALGSLAAAIAALGVSAGPVPEDRM